MNNKIKSLLAKKQSQTEPEKWAEECRSIARREAMSVFPIERFCQVVPKQHWDSTHEILCKEWHELDSGDLVIQGEGE